MKKIYITFLLFNCLTGTLLYAEENSSNQIPEVSIGINGNFGSFDMYSKDMDLEITPGIYTGGGITIEKMIYSKFAIGSGIQYRYFNSDFVMDDGVSTFDATWNFHTINIPFLMILSLSGGESALNLAAGVVYSHIFRSEMTTDTTLTVDTHDDDALKYINRNQIGLTAGIIFKIRATKFTDFMFGVMGEYYPQNLLYNGGDNLNMINYSLTTGWMFRTNIFPGSK